MPAPKYKINENGLKSCTKCEEFKTLDSFSPRKNYRTGGYYPGGSSHCIECQRGACANWAKNNNTYNIKRAKVYRLTKRQTVLNHYGGKCACCGIDNYEFLAIDHIDGNGSQQRKELGDAGRGQNFVSWLIRNDLPEGYQVLCHNCNFAKGAYGQCPHQRGYSFENFIKR
jgi:hypothetical protein